MSLIMLLLGVLPLRGYNYITPRRAGLSATAGLSCFNSVSIHPHFEHLLSACLTYTWIERTYVLV